MNKNYIAEFMKENDLKIGDVFSVANCGEYHFEDDFAIYDENGDYDDVLLFDLLAGRAEISKLPQKEYVEVDNSVPRFAEIEVRNGDCEEWQSALFLFKFELAYDEFPYLTTNIEKNTARNYAQARMLKPTEPEFKEGELIEVSNDGDYWCKREFVRSEETVVTTVNDCGIGESNWKWIRKIEGKQ